MYLPTRLPSEAETETSDPVALSLLRAAQVIRERGWCQNKLRAGDGRVCMLGALHMAWPRHMESQLTGELLIAIRSAIGPGQLIANWNDTPGRTADEVVSALERAALSRATAIRGV